MHNCHFGFRIILTSKQQRKQTASFIVKRIINAKFLLKEIERKFHYTLYLY